MSQQLTKRVRRLFTDGSGAFVPYPKHRIINWGCSSAIDKLRTGVFINAPDAVAVAANKLLSFQKFAGNGSINIPAFSADQEVAESWINEGKVVVCRTKLNGHSGAGIVLAARTEDLSPRCPLFVQYIKKAKEFRVHVAFGSVIDIQAKRKRTDFNGETDYAIRNHHTGWVYCRENIEEPNDLREQALKAILTLGLHFGAVDLIYNQHQNKSFVLEVNTAPGLAGSTVESYATAFREHLTLV